MRYLILFLMLCGACWPAAATYYLTDGAGANDLNPPFHESVVTAAQCIGATGAAIYTADDAAAGACSTADAGVRTTITMAAGQTLPTIIAGTYVYVDFAASYTDGWYRINASDIGARTITIDCTYIDTSDVDAIRIGGARPCTVANLNLLTTLANTDYNIANGTATALDWTTNKIDVKIYTAAAVDFGATTWAMVARVGATFYWVDIWACNSSWVPTAGAAIFTTTNDANTGLIQFNAAGDMAWYLKLHGFYLNCADNAAYGIYPSATTSIDDSFLVLDRITVSDADVDGFSLRSLQGAAIGITKVVGCISTSNTGYGFSEATGSKCSYYIGCNANNNGSGGFFSNGVATYIGCVSYLNIANGYLFGTSSDDTYLIGCVADSNGSDGFDIPSGTDQLTIVACISNDNTGKGFNAANTSKNAYFGYNVIYGNTDTSVVDNVALSDSAFLTYGIGSNLSAADPLFVAASTGNFSLSASSTLRNTFFGTFWTGPAGGGSVQTGFNGGFDQ